MSWDSYTSFVLGNLERGISVHEANVDLSKESILESQAENKVFG